jgi:hypothetical protein
MSVTGLTFLAKYFCWIVATRPAWSADLPSGVHRSNQVDDISEQHYKKNNPGRRRGTGRMTKPSRSQSRNQPVVPAGNQQPFIHLFE